MKKSQVLININNISDIDTYKKVGITNFLFAINGLSIGYTSFDVDDVPDNSYLLINRVFDCKGIDEFKSIIPKLNRFKGVIFEDLGVYNLLKDSNLELIWSQAHFVTNYNSINYYLEHGCKSAVVSNEITKEEILDIFDKAIKPLVFNVLGSNMVM
nr:U32 family peptidase [Bacilli bacterium]